MNEKYYVHGCIEIDGTVGYMEDQDAEFWTLYARDASGESEALADFADRRSAEAAMAVYAERDALGEQVRTLHEVNHRQAMCIHLTAQEMGAEVSATTEALPKAARHINAQVRALAAECASLKSNLMFWDSQDPETPYDSPEEIADENLMECGDEFTVQVAARMPNLTYTVIAVNKDSCELELVKGALPETPATDAILREVGAKAVEGAAGIFTPCSFESSAIHRALIGYAARLRSGEVQP